MYKLYKMSMYFIWFQKTKHELDSTTLRVGLGKVPLKKRRFLKLTEESVN